MITISNEQAKDLRNAFKCWQQDYDPVEDKEQYDMFGLGVVAMDELLALRKERERAEPTGVTAEHKRVIQLLLNVCGAAFELADDSCQQLVDGEDCHVVPDDSFQKLSVALDEIENTLPGEYEDTILQWGAIPRHALCGLLVEQSAPPAPVVVDDSLPFDPQIAEYEQMMEAELKSAARTAYKVKSELSQMAEKLVRDTKALAATMSEETDTTAQQFESLAGKAVSGWIPCSERMPEEMVDVLVTDGEEVKGMWWNCRGWDSWDDRYAIDSDDVTHWQPLPELPCK
ncbi:DUF551 domain-containing protein [Cronobacter sakazakii]